MTMNWHQKHGSSVRLQPCSTDKWLFPSSHNSHCNQHTKLGAHREGIQWRLRLSYKLCTACRSWILSRKNPPVHLIHEVTWLLFLLGVLSSLTFLMVKYSTVDSAHWTLQRLLGGKTPAQVFGDHPCGAGNLSLSSGAKPRAFFYC